MDDNRALKRMPRDNCVNLRGRKLRRIAARGSALQSSPSFIRCVGSEHDGDERSECGEQMVPESLRGSRLVESSHELEHAIEVGPRIAVHSESLATRIVRLPRGYVK